MSSDRAIPKGYMTVGEVAKKMNTTVRTLQYYDKEGLLQPSGQSEGGRRLYTDKDVVRLHQIQSLKYLGFSLDDIKNRLVSLETPEQVAAALSEQAEIVREKISTLTEMLHAIELLKEETLQMQNVNFPKYAAIVVNLQMKNEFYWMVKNFDDKTLDTMHRRFDLESGRATVHKLQRMIAEAEALQKEGVPPESEQGQALARDWWDMVEDFTGGDMTLLPDLMKLTQVKEDKDGVWKEKVAVMETYVSSALSAYFTRIGYNPFEEVAL